MDNFVLIIYLQVILCALASAGIKHVKTYRGYKGYKVYGNKTALDKLEGLLRKSDNRLISERHRGSWLHTYVPRELAASFEETVDDHNLRTKLVYNDIAEVIRKEKARRGDSYSWTKYHDVVGIYGYLQNMSLAYPRWAELVVGGLSYEGRQIQGLRINTPEGRYQYKPAIFIESGIHAREWVTSASTTYFINELLTSNNSDIEDLRNLFDWHIFPLVNPDGYDYSHKIDRMWRKTRTKYPGGCYGADPNRNWDYDWLMPGASNSCESELYAGPQPFSEKETDTLSSYICNVGDLLGFISIHSCAQALLFPYSDSDKQVKNYKDLIAIGKKSLEYGHKVSGVKYRGPGTASDALSITASGVSMDWVLCALNTPLVYTYELPATHSFFWPPEQVPQQGEELTQMLLGLARGAEALGYLDKRPRSRAKKNKCKCEK